MIEKHIVLEDIDPVIFYGVNNANIQMIKALYPKLRIVARGNVIKVMGDEEEMCAFEESIIALEKHCVKYNSLKEEVIIDIIKGNIRKPGTDDEPKDKRNNRITSNTAIEEPGRQSENVTIFIGIASTKPESKKSPPKKEKGIKPQRDIRLSVCLFEYFFHDAPRNSTLS